MTGSYISHYNAGTMLAYKGHEMVPVNLVASTPVEGRHQDRGWTCQNFLLEGFQALVNGGYQTQEWYNQADGEPMDALLDGEVA